MGEKTCRVFTPPAIVNYMLDRIGYTDNLYGKKILENSCGTGRFLCEIVRRYIVDARRSGKTDEEIRKGLETDICGVEKATDIYSICKENLDHAAADLGIVCVRWNLHQGDALLTEYGSDYQYIVGNPPYITYYNLPEEERTAIRDAFSVCRKGKADYYYAFTEAAIRALASDGIMAYLIPNNFMKNRDSEALRRYILPYLTVLEDFKFEKIFDNYQTSSAIIICSKKDMQEEFLYINREENSTRTIRKEDLQGKWVFGSGVSEKNHARRFGDCFRVSAPVATLLNEAFVIKDYTENDSWVEVNGLRLEREGLRPAASPKSKQYQEDNYIIFPYYYEEEHCRNYTPEAFEGLFPQIAEYLRSFSDKLSKRKTDKNSKWFEYGRSQALNHIDQEKIMLSTLVTDRVKYYVLDREVVPYSGMYIVPKKQGYTLAQAEQILQSADFYEYVKSVGINANGRTYRISPRDVADYIFDKSW